MKTLYIRLKAWYKWQKYINNTMAYKLSVLFGKRKSEAFDLLHEQEKFISE